MYVVDENTFFLLLVTVLDAGDYATAVLFVFFYYKRDEWWCYFCGKRTDLFEIDWLFTPAWPQTRIMSDLKKFLFRTSTRSIVAITERWCWMLTMMEKGKVNSNNTHLDKIFPHFRSDSIRISSPKRDIFQPWLIDWFILQSIRLRIWNIGGASTSNIQQNSS